MITIAHFTDQHWWEKNRWQETLKIADWTLADLRQRKPDVITMGGDIFEGASTLTERNAAGDWLCEARKIAPVLGVYGNHEVDHELGLYNQISGIHFARGPMLFRNVAERPLTLLLLPWPRKANLLAALEKPVAPEDADAAAREHLRNIIRGMGNDVRGDDVRVMVAHAMVDGSMTSVGQPMRDAELTIGLEDLALARCDAYLLGHIHKPQHWEVSVDGKTAPVIYGGSWRRTTYGEVEQKGYVLLKLTPCTGAPHIVTWERVPTPCAPMHLFEARWNGTGFVDVVVDSGATGATEPTIPTETAAGWDGAEIRFRYAVDADQRPAAKAAADRAKQLWLEAGAADVVLDPQTNPETRARMPEIATELTVAGKLEMLWRSRADAPDDARRARLLSKLAVLEREAQ